MKSFSANCARLAGRDALLAARLRESGGGVLSVTAARNGLPTATIHGRWVHSAYDPWNEAEVWAEAQAKAYQSGEVAVVLGVGLLYHVEALVRRLPADARVTVVVPDLRELHDACEARDLTGWVDRAAWRWGEPGQIARGLAESDRPLRFLTYAPAARLHADVHARIEEALRRRLAAQAGGQLHVAVVGPIYGGSLPIARYAASALETLGHRVNWIDHSAHDGSYRILGGLKEPRHRLTLQGKFAEMLGLLTLVRLAEDPPDLVIALAQAPLEMPVLEHLRRKKFLTAIWFVENYRHLTYWQQLAAGYDHWFVIQKGAYEEMLRRAGAPHVTYLPLAADPAVHRSIELSDSERAEFGADVSFVGAGYANRRAILPRLVKAEWTFKLWGNEWDGATDLGGVLQRQGSRIDTETCVKIFNATTINLNLHSFTGTTLDPQGDFVNPRTFELAACGAFQLTDRRSLLPEVFTAEEVACFESPDELPSQIRQWLHEPEARQAMAKAALRRVLAEHTYVHRMRDLLAEVGLRQPDRVGSILRGDRQASRLVACCDKSPELIPLLRQFPDSQRVELKALASRIRAKGPTAKLSRDELLVLMLDEYRSETRDLV
ncbi:MAG: glycosyltransferase [Nitrospirota bacterium]